MRVSLGRGQYNRAEFVRENDWKTEAFIGDGKFERNDWQPMIRELAKRKNSRTRLRQMQGSKTGGRVC
jgi:hypothetical protein